MAAISPENVWAGTAPQLPAPTLTGQIRGAGRRRKGGGRRGKGWGSFLWGTKVHQGAVHRHGLAGMGGLPPQTSPRPRPEQHHRYEPRPSITGQLPAPNGGELPLAARREPIARYLRLLPVILTSFSSALFASPWALPGHHDALVGSPKNMLPCYRLGHRFPALLPCQQPRSKSPRHPRVGTVVRLYGRTSTPYMSLASSFSPP